MEDEFARLGIATHEIIMDENDRPADNSDTLYVSDKILFDEMKRRVQAGWIPECGHYFTHLISVLKARLDHDQERWREL